MHINRHVCLETSMRHMDAQPFQLELGYFEVTFILV
jgi:hypothetical protein